jgi:tetratricopeptide (TPR) repeat protein
VEASSVNGEAQPERGPRPVNKRLVLLVGVALVLVAVGIAAWRPLLRSYRLSQGRLALESREARLALQYFHAARQLAPEHAETHFQIARAHRQLGQLDRVHESLKTAWRLGYDIASLEREQWLVLAQAGELNDAEPQLIALLSDPEETRHPEISEALVRGYFIHLRFAEAQQMLDAWQADYPKDAEPHFLRGYFHEAFNRYEDAVAEYQRGLEKSPRRTDGRLRLGRLLMQQQDFAGAERELSRCLSEQPLDLQVRVAWAAYLFAAGRIDDAHREFQQVLIRAPDNEEALRLMGQIELAAQRPNEALRWLLPAAEKNPCDLTVRRTLGEALQAVGREDEAQQHFQFVEEAERELPQLDAWLSEVLKDPGNASLRYKIGTTVLRYRSPTDGVRWLKTVLEIDPDHLETHRTLAEYYAAQGDQQAAQRHLQHIAERDSQ